MIMAMCMWPRGSNSKVFAMLFRYATDCYRKDERIGPTRATDWSLQYSSWRQERDNNWKWWFQIIPDDNGI